MARITRKQLVERARAAGLRLIERSGHVWIGREGRGAVEVVVRPDGSAWRSDVRVDLATRLSLNEAASLLGLGRA